MAGGRSRGEKEREGQGEEEEECSENGKSVRECDKQ